MKSYTFVCLLCTLNLYLLKKCSESKSCSRLVELQRVALNAKVDQKLPSTIGTDLTDSRYVQLWKIIDLTSGKQ